MDKNFFANKKIVCCLTVRNCEPYFSKIFANLDILSKEFQNFYVVFVHDNCSDNSESILNEYKNLSLFTVYVVHNIENNSEFRTIRIANSRNKCLNIVYNVIRDVDFHFMIDADNVNENPWNIDLIKDYLKQDTWDGLSFNRNNYYDIWALMYDKYMHHCWGYADNSLFVALYMQRDIQNKLNNLSGDLFECFSAFNGFAIYRSPCFVNILYDGLYTNVKLYVSDEMRNITKEYIINSTNNHNILIDENCIEHCEHLNFHLSAIKENNARIRISKYIL